MSDDISLEELMDKYGLVMDGNRRYYKESLLKRDFYLENTTPYRFKIRDRVFEETSWGELLRVTAIYLFETFPEKGSQRSFISNRLVKAGNFCFREENEFQRGLSRALGELQSHRLARILAVGGFAGLLRYVQRRRGACHS